MDKNFLYKLYKSTSEFQNWEREDKYSSFDEAEREFFDMIDEARSNGMNYINRGGDRDVYNGGSVAGEDKVVKIARESLMQNQNAVDVWINMPEEAKQYVAPIHDWGDGYEWIIQSKAGGRGDVVKVGEKLSEFGYYVSDLNGENVSTFEGRSVLVDLGLIQ